MTVLEVLDEEDAVAVAQARGDAYPDCLTHPRIIDQHPGDLTRTGVRSYSHRHGNVRSVPAAMIADAAPAVRRPRRRGWRRDPRVVLAGAATAVVGFVMLGGNVYGALTTGQQPLRVTVHAGDTLWGIAAAHDRGGDVRDAVDRIVSLNHLAGASITPGEDLLLPAP